MSYTHGHHDTVLRSHRWRTIDNSAAYLADALVPGRSVLDVGCGPGTISLEFAAAVAPGVVTAVDTAEAAVAETRAAAESAAVTNLVVEVADLYDLPYSAGSFDVVHAHQVLQHVPDPVAALRALRRLIAPGGVLAARDADYDAMYWHPRLPELDEWRSLYRRVARLNGGEPDAARLLPSWARSAGFPDVRYTTTTWCFATAEDRRWWGGMWADRMRHSAVGETAVREGFVGPEDLDRIARGWLAWADDPDAVFVVPHGEIRCRER
ncbi:class I SAM-dependent methyltransferase [Stackebrandtia soli]|uniref:class I SAM-dependent methyltransferase n=1 Tax=Stackebrandtia soli TaxID=1892856 RepID=UPI0039E7A709